MSRALKAAVALIFLGGFFVGTAVNAGSGGGPGSASDPLASKSYVTQAVNQRVAELQQQVSTLGQRVDQLTNTIAALEGIVTSGGAVIEEAVEAKAGAFFLSREVQVYSEPADDADRIAVLGAKEDFEVIEEQAGWYKVKLADGTRGWIKAEYVRTK